ncbi:MAG: dephospho-CoA kinase [Candidatus Dadabacteria bacterium]|nr:MAG: dephospho-CoA kinase [Candidatus Dadabacteria bacterium]
MVVGLTGCIGSGKSTAAEILREHGAKIIDADLLAREVVAPGSQGLSEVINHFGKQYLTAAGELDRKKLAALVFNDQQKRAELEKILHPKIRELFLKKLEETLRSNPGVIVYVVPLLFESKLSREELNYTAVVYAPAEVCINRIMVRDGLSYKEAEKRLAAQMDIEEKRRLADYVIDNSGGIEELRNEIVGFLKKLR